MKSLARLLMLAMLVATLGLFGCDDGDDGDSGAPGASAYQLWLDQGNTGTVQDFLDSLQQGAASTATTESCTLCHDTGDIAGIENYHALDEATGLAAYDTPIAFVMNSVTLDPVGGTVTVNFNLPGFDSIPVNTSRVRFTFSELVPAGSYPVGARTVWTGPDQWVRHAYVRPVDPEGTLVNNTGGNYDFTFEDNILSMINNTANVFRVAGQATGDYDGSTDFPDTNWSVDFDFDGVTTFTERTVASGRDIATTVACNSCHERLAIHGGRYEYEYCVTCHNPTGTATAEADMTFMTHVIHAAGTFTELDGGTFDVSEVTYPADLRECQKCHAGPNADLGLTRPYRASCGSCHQDVNFATGAGHGENNIGGAQLNDDSCGVCHAPDVVAAYHEIPEYASDFTYTISEVTVTDGAPVVTFGITESGTPITACPPVGFTGGPNFKVAYAVAAEGVDGPIDYNNYDNGEDAAQPVSIGLCDVFATATNNLNGTYTATLATTFPEGATLRTVGIDGYFQLDGVRQQTESAVAYVTGEERRMVVDNAKCLACHENLALHGGNRVNKVEMCVICHNPNLSSSGHELDPTLPEDSQNMKDMVHGIHAAAFRTTDYEHARNFRGNASYYNWSEVTYPNAEGVQHCYVCHNSNLELLETQDGALASSVVGNDRSMPEDDENVSPISAACYYCHDTDSAKTHMQQNGGAFDLPQSLIGQ